MIPVIKITKEEYELYEKYKTIFDKLTCRDCVHFDYKSVDCCNEDRHTDKKCELFDID